ncbi:MAG: DUF3108 domain-containing protein [Taibaiella sp.]|nr:DUF3108 domain-containing protein [Taibaiella sp.]
MKWRSTGVALLVMLMALTARGQNCLFKNSSFREGEKLTFRVYYNMSFIWINSGNAEFTILSDDYDNHKAYHIKGVGHTAKSFEWFYKVTDVYESYVDKETMLPLKFQRNVNEGGLKFNNEVVFNHSKGKVVSDKKEYAIPKCTQDVLSSMYFARNVDYNKYLPGDRIPFTMFLDNKVYNLYIKYLGKERVATKMGTFNAIKISPLLIEGTIFKEGNKMTIWLSDDDNHLPVRIESPILIGNIKIDLLEYENLRSPFAGLISKK